MKKPNLILTLFYTFPVLFLFPHQSFSQSTIYQRLDSVILIGANEKIEYYYDESGLNTSMIHFNWSNDSMKYLPDEKYEYSYYADNFCKEQLKYDWHNDSFRLLTKTTFSYDANNQLLLKKYYSAPTNWDLIIKTDYVNKYDDKGRLIETKLYENRKSQPDIKEYKYEYSYSPNGNLSSIFYYDLAISPYGVPDFKGDFIYNENGILTYNEYYYRDGGVGYSNWRNNIKEDFNLNFEYSINQILTPYDYYSNRFLLPTDFNISYMITELNHEDLTGNADYLKRFYYSEMVVTGINQNVISEISIYPNPATDYLTIATGLNESTISLFNQTGKEIISKNVSGNYKIPVSHYPAGLYLLRVESGNGKVQTEKIIIN